MFLYLFFIVMLIVMYANPLFYSICLLLVVISSVVFLVINMSLSMLTGLILVIVYVGAIIIFISYICAVTPNIKLEPNFNFFGLILASIVMCSFIQNLDFNSEITVMLMSDFFYSIYGVVVFFSLIFMLFTTLLIVTSQHSTSSGPLRAIN